MYMSEREIVIADICAHVCHCHPTPEQILPKGLILMQESVAAVGRTRHQYLLSI